MAISLEARLDRRLPARLAAAHRRLEVGDRIDLVVHGSDAGAGPRSAPTLPALLVGAGFSIDGVRLRSLPDTVGSRMRLLVCGLNPSLYAADAGVGFARRGNRFWPAMLAAGLVDRGFDADHALRAHRIGMTDLCKRATVASAELAREEYVDGMARLERLAAWLRPAAVVFVGLEGWRAAVDAGAAAGWQAAPIGGRPAYVMPSTSGLNAHARLDDLAAHLRVAAAGTVRT